MTVSTATLPLTRPPAHSVVYAALDLGTNNCRLLIARPASGGFRVLDAFSRIVRLGEGLARSGELSEAAMDRTIAALAVCAQKVRARRVDHLRAVATEACRQAGNCGLFLDRVRAETGLEVETISAAEEARLVLAGCTPLLDPLAVRALLFDIGGGSTELLWVGLDGREPVMLGYSSLPMGVVTLADRYGGREVSPDLYCAMRDEAAAALERFDDAHGISAWIGDGRMQMLGSSGTVTTLAGVHLGLPRYNRGLVDGIVLDRTSVDAASRRLLDMDYAGRAAHPCIGPERADLVLAGCAILSAITERWPCPRLRVADRGVREGILYGLMARNGRRHRIAS
ncbi:Ppx/GppA phosphatase family protein [Stella sp.]|uniref:Ppx/GppA phosphatase family protein n=1 Tax=Stella sp. TaxID=2912054 RepID=UPI0035B0CF86